jgi:hypothetical protein
VRDRRRGGWRPPPDEEGQDNTLWTLLWVIGGAATFTAIMYFLDLL